ncbi:MAG TPA: NAD(P)-binding protein [Ktedonobacterales bacterium]|nr:NAD(P)-binding protein [Ktedonobacterales bacterium]
MSAIAILGTGMAALGASYRLRGEKHRCVLYDKNTYAGGHTVTARSPDGFSFDVGPHVSFTKDERIQELFANAVNGAYEDVKYSLNNYWQGHWIVHPVQTNLYGLPPDVITKIVLSFVEEMQKPLGEVENYAEWLIASYGKVMAETFPMAYTAKYHTTPAENLRTDWIGPRMYRPTLEEVLMGALTPKVANVHYVQSFRYPTYGGFQAYPDGLRGEAEVVLGHELVRLDPSARELIFRNGARVAYDALVSSIALPDLIPMIVGVPAEVVEAVSQLACSSVVLVNVGLGRADNISKVQISYFYDRDVIFSRLCFPHMFSPNNVPPGHGSIQAEVYFSKKYMPMSGTPESCIEPVIADLRRVGLIREDDEILYKNATFAKYANIIFDHDRPKALATVHGYLDEIGVNYCGRYGDWAYLWTDDSFKSGERAAESALARL